MATHYAWTRIVGADKDGKPFTVQRGEKVTATMLNVNSTEFDQMVDSGAIRTKPHPAPDDYSGSAIDYLRDQLREASGQTEASVEEAEAVQELSQLEKVAG
jgi:hypothetical protein